MSEKGQKCVVRGLNPAVSVAIKAGGHLAFNSHDNSRFSHCQRERERET